MKKNIFYQGYISRSRYVYKICEACERLEDYTFVMMGGGDQNYIEEFKSRYSNIIHIGFVRPSEHLNITSYARMAIVKYDFVVLNAIYCAPNKTWEYTCFGIPVLAYNIPGLEYTIGSYNAGVCCDMDNQQEIKETIRKIDSNYEQYHQNAITFYNSFDVRETIL
ncbi:MAG: glycosyltransferase [Candidatus Pacebacteria bacterium]|nr:glycosyltransferase [Candidatus Paceibacterota bacterium]